MIKVIKVEVILTVNVIVSLRTDVGIDATACVHVAFRYDTIIRDPTRP